MNARTVCAIVMTLAVLIGLSTQPARAGHMPESVIEEVRLQGELALMRIKADQLYAARQSSREALVNLCPALDNAFAVASAEIELQGQLALWSIQESELAGFRTGNLLRLTTAQHLNRGAYAVVQTPENSKLDQARNLIESTKLELPQFLPAILR